MKHNFIDPIQVLFYDKIAFTFPIRKSKRLLLIDRLNDPNFYEKYNRRVYGHNNGRYQNNYQFEIFQWNTIKLSVYPINTSHNFLRVEYNPRNLGVRGRKKFRLFLIKLLTKDVMKKIYFHARLTRLDLTLDVFDMEPGLYIHRSRIEQSEIYRDKFGYKIISQVIGSEMSNRRITMYDKRAEQGIEDSIALDFDFYPSFENISHHRIEIRLRNLDCTMAELDRHLLKEFKAINFYKDSFLEDEGFSKEFRDDAYENGLNSALYILVDQERRRYLKLLENYRIKPLSFKKRDMDFDAAHKEGLRSLVHREYEQQFLAQVA
ncbi:MAG: hypothetical protein ABL933_02695 [Methyloglobulus sp.]|nr:hypothetical protein [Methyloglobulus sp.]